VSERAANFSRDSPGARHQKGRRLGQGPIRFRQQACVRVRGDRDRRVAEQLLDVLQVAARRVRERRRAVPQVVQR